MSLKMYLVAFGTILGVQTTCALASSNQGMVKHTVFFRYKSRVMNNPKQLKEIRRRFLDLKSKSLKNGLPYIVSIDAGYANSSEGLDQNLFDGYILTFKNEEDRDYYVGCNENVKCSEGGFKLAGLPYDRAHDHFKIYVGPLLYDADGDGIPVPEGVFVFDFTAE